MTRNRIYITSWKFIHEKIDNVDLNLSNIGNKAHQIYANLKLGRKLNSKAEVESLVFQR